MSPVLRFSKREQTFKFKDVPRKPVPSLLRGFTSPVNLEHDLSNSDLEYLAQHDSDAFVRWEALQTLMANEISTMYNGTFLLVCTCSVKYIHKRTPLITKKRRPYAMEVTHCR